MSNIGISRDRRPGRAPRYYDKARRRALARARGITAAQVAVSECILASPGSRVLHIPDPQVDDWNRGDGTVHPRHTGTAPRAAYTVLPRTTKSTEGQFMDEPAAQARAAQLEAEGYDIEWLTSGANEHAGRMLYRQSITGRPHALLCRGVPDDPRWLPFWRHHFRIEIVA